MAPARKPQQEGEDSERIGSEKYKILTWAVERIGLPTILVLGIGWVMVNYWIRPQQEERVALRDTQQLMIDSQQKISLGQQNTIDSLVSQTSALRETLMKLTDIVAGISKRQDTLESAVLMNQKILLSMQTIAETQQRQNDALQAVVTGIMETMISAKAMMKDVPAQREEENKLLKELVEETKKRN